jgi:hypothetical protein
MIAWRSAGECLPDAQKAVAPAEGALECVAFGTSCPSGKRCGDAGPAILNNCFARLQKYAFRLL